jgi:hypothetical protein
VSTPLSDPDNVMFTVVENYVSPALDDGFTDDEVARILNGQPLTASASAETFHLPGKHEQKSHGIRKGSQESSATTLNSPMPEQVAMRSPATRSAARKVVRAFYNDKSVTGEQLYTPEERNAIEAYGDKWYSSVNAALRSKTTTGLSQEYRSGHDLNDLITRMDNALEKSRTTDDLVVYRGVDPSVFGELRAGDILQDDAYVSTSMSPVTAGIIGERILEISLPKGSRATRPNKDEMELMLARGTRFKVVSIDDESVKVAVL